MKDDPEGHRATASRRDRKKKRKRQPGNAPQPPEQPQVNKVEEEDTDAVAVAGEDPPPEPTRPKRKTKSPKKQRTIDPKLKEIPEAEGEGGDAGSDDDDDDDDDAYLQREAAAWAARCGPNEASAPRESPAAAAQSPAPTENAKGKGNGTGLPGRSVHVTQIAFTATQLDLQHHFAKAGCLVSSVRMVYDMGIEKSRQFRGVAFVDLADEPSFRVALQLDKSVLLGRKVNVRPTKSAAELSSIVLETREKVAHKIRSSKEQQQQQLDQEKASKMKPSPVTKAQSTEAKGNHKEMDASRSHGADGERKLTKKERNRRAAILRQRGRHGRS